MAPVLVYDDVKRSFDAPVLDGVTLEVEEGERLGIVGPSGTGKSVLLKMAAWLIAPDAGDVRVFGRSLVHGKARDVAEVRAQVGYVFQNAALFDSMSVRDNLAYGLRQDGPGSTRADVEDRLRRALLEVRLDPDAVLDKLPAELSGGMKKRVGLARALVPAPRLMLFDEPVTGLDPINAAAVSQLIARLTTERGFTSVLVTHDVEGALELCTRVALLAGGKLVFVGTPAAFRESSVPLVRAFAYREAAARLAQGLS